jgi:hypothetical protein
MTVIEEMMAAGHAPGVRSASLRHDVDLASAHPLPLVAAGDRRPPLRRENGEVEDVVCWTRET